MRAPTPRETAAPEKVLVVEFESSPFQRFLRRTEPLPPPRERGRPEPGGGDALERADGTDDSRIVGG